MGAKRLRTTTSLNQQEEIPMSEIEDLIAKGQEELNEGKYKAAMTAFKKVIALDAKNPEGYFGVAEASIGNPKMSLVEVAQHYKQAIELDPTNTIYYTSYADFCFQNGLLPQGEANFLKAIDVDKDNAPLYYNDLSFNYINAGFKFIERVQEMKQTKYDVMKKAIDYSLKAIEIPVADAVKIAKALATKETKFGEPNNDAEEAKKLSSIPEAKELLNALKKEGDNPYIYVEIGQLCFDNGLPKTGEDYYLKASELDPSNSRFFLSELKVNLAMYAKGNAIKGVSKDDLRMKLIHYTAKSLRVTPEDIVYVFTGESIEKK